MKILYVHGFQSSFDRTSDKISKLETIGEVFGKTIDYSKRTYKEILKELVEYSIEIQADLIVGSSLGGFYASWIGTTTDTPFVAINPCIDPLNSLKKYTMEDSIRESYEDTFNKNGYGYILLDLGDDIIDPKKTIEELTDHYGIQTFEGGNHRFAHMEESIEGIESFFEFSQFIYGLLSV